MKVDEYPLRLTETDRVRVVLKKDHGKIKHFVIQYYGLINRRFITIMRVDTCHRYAHKHTYYQDGRQQIVKLSGDLSVVFNANLKRIKEDYQGIKENYLTNR